MRKTLLLVGLLLFSLSVAACDSGTPTDEPPTVVSKFLQAQKEERYNDAYTLISEDSRSKLTADAFSGRLKQARMAAKIKDIAVLKVSDRPIIAGSRAAVSYSIELTLEDGSKTAQNETAVLLRQANNWLIVWPPPGSGQLEQESASRCTL